MDEPQPAEFAYLTVGKLYAALHALVLKGGANAIVCTRHAGENFDVVRLSITKMPKILTIVSNADMIRREDDVDLVESIQTDDSEAPAPAVEASPEV